MTVEEEDGDALRQTRYIQGVIFGRVRVMFVPPRLSQQPVIISHQNSVFMVI